MARILVLTLNRPKIVGEDNKLGVVLKEVTAGSNGLPVVSPIHNGLGNH